MYVSPKFRSGSHAQLNNARRFRKHRDPIDGAVDGDNSNPSQRQNLTRAAGTNPRIRSSSHRSSDVETAGAVWLENVGTGNACNGCVFMLYRYACFVPASAISAMR